MPRHPPYALNNLYTEFYLLDARVHCAVLKLRSVALTDPTLTEFSAVR